MPSVLCDGWYGLEDPAFMMALIEEGTRLATARFDNLDVSLSSLNRFMACGLGAWYFRLHDLDFWVGIGQAQDLEAASCPRFLFKRNCKHLYNRPFPPYSQTSKISRHPTTNHDAPLHASTMHLFNIVSGPTPPLQYNFNRR